MPGQVLAHPEPLAYLPFSPFLYLLLVRRPSSVVCLLSLNDFSSKIPWLIFFKLHVELSVKGRGCNFVQMSLIKMAAKPIYNKNV